MSAARAESGTRRTLETLMSELRDRIELVEAENARLRSELARLAHENSEQCDLIYELQQMVNRAHT